MSLISEKLAEEGISLRRDQQGDQKAKCPKCGGGRTKELSLSVTIRDDGAVWVCHRASCGWKGQVNTRAKDEYVPRYSRPRAAPIKPSFVPKADGLTEEVLAWFSGRGISRETLERNHITYVRAWMPGPNAEVGCIAFPYLRDGEVVNVKYRDGRKHFRQEKGAEKILFGMDNVPADADTLIWVEGEMDVVSFNEAGLWNVVSVPDGAPKEVREDDIDPEEDRKFEYIWNCQAFIGRFRRHILAVDNDRPGKALEEELARRLNKERCWRVTWPDGANDTMIKDANEMLMASGAAMLKAAPDQANAYPISGLYDAEDFEADYWEFYENGHQSGFSTGWTNINPLMTIRPGELSVVTGYPSSGKSEFVDALCVNLAVMHQWTFAVCSFENTPEEHIPKWGARYIGKAFLPDKFTGERMGRGEAQQALSWANRFFHLIRANDETPTIDWLLSKATVAVIRFGIRGLVLDPYNEFEHQRDSGMTETEYVSQMLGKVKRWGQQHGVHVWFVAHPKKPPVDQQNEAPSLYDISGSANWVNKADIGVVVHRRFLENGKRDTVAEIHVKKVRFRSVGEPGLAHLEYMPGYGGRYVERD